MKIKHDIIKFLEYGMQYPEGVTKPQMLDELKVDEVKIEELWREIRDKRHNPFKYSNNKISDLFYIIDKKDIQEPNDSDFFSKAKITINIDGFFRLLQYCEINDARRSSKRALCAAIIAIIIGILAEVWQIILNYYPPNL